MRKKDINPIKNKILRVRIEENLYNKLKDKVENKNISEYIRNIIVGHLSINVGQNNEINDKRRTFLDNTPKKNKNNTDKPIPKQTKYNPFQPKEQTDKNSLDIFS